jgi:hypothetical protein
MVRATMGRKMRASIDNRERETGMNGYSYIAGEDLDVGEIISLGNDGRVYRWNGKEKEDVVGKNSSRVTKGNYTSPAYWHNNLRRSMFYSSFVEFGEQGWEMLDNLHGIMKSVNDSTDAIIHALISDPICPNCGTTTHHKGFREWEECDGCGAEWRTG